MTRRDAYVGQCKAGTDLQACISCGHGPAGEGHTPPGLCCPAGPPTPGSPQGSGLQRKHTHADTHTHTLHSALSIPTH